MIDYRNLADRIADHSTCPITRVIHYCPIRTYTLETGGCRRRLTWARIFVSDRERLDDNDAGKNEKLVYN